MGCETSVKLELYFSYDNAALSRHQYSKTPIIRTNWRLAWFGYAEILIIWYVNKLRGLSKKKNDWQQMYCFYKSVKEKKLRTRFKIMHLCTAPYSTKNKAEGGRGVPKTTAHLCHFSGLSIQIIANSDIWSSHNWCLTVVYSVCPVYYNFTVQHP